MGGGLMGFFLFMIIFVLIQRMLELFLARKHERLMKAKGAVERGGAHYSWLVAMHGAFFLALIGETILRANADGVPILFIPLSVFFIAQVLRMHVLRSLGVSWNTKIIILPEAEGVKTGAYRWLRHPNYIIVALEFMSLPLIFGDYFTAAIFSVFNALFLLLVRIPEEEKALAEAGILGK